MRTVFLRILTIVFMGTSGFLLADEAEVGAERLEISVALYEGQIEGGKGPMKANALAHPRIVAQENQQFQVTIGQDMSKVEREIGTKLPPLGFVIEGQCRLVQDDNIRLDIAIANNELRGELSPERIEIRTTSNRTIVTLKAGETLKLSLGQSEDGVFRWAEFTPRILAPATRCPMPGVDREGPCEPGESDRAEVPARDPGGGRVGCGGGSVNVPHPNGVRFYSPGSAQRSGAQPWV